jgi:hypothetical protein
MYCNLTMGILKRLHELLFPAIGLLLLVEYQLYSHLPVLESSLLSAVDPALASKYEDSSSFSTLFRPDDHAISVPSIPIDCSRILLLPTELSAVSRKSMGA